MNDVFSPSISISMSEDIRAFVAAKIAAQRNFKATGLDSLNPHFKAKYAKLKQIYEAVELALADQNIAIFHFRQWLEDRPFLATRLVHSLTGQWIQDLTLLEPEKPGMQGHGAALTFMKRYAVLNLCAIPQGEDDDDGEEERKYIEEQQNSPEITDDQYDQLVDALEACADPVDALRGVLSYNKVKDIGHLKQSQFAGALHAVRSKPKKG